MLIHTNSFSSQLFHLQRLYLTETNQYILPYMDTIKPFLKVILFEIFLLALIKVLPKIFRYPGKSDLYGWL